MARPLNSEWPAGVETISLDGLDRLGVDAQNQLYWDGKPLEVKQSLSFTGWQKVWAGVVSFTIVIGGLGSFVQGWTAYNTWACQSNWEWIGFGCKPPSRHDLTPLPGTAIRGIEKTIALP
jgi:hypothetical protein